MSQAGKGTAFRRPFSIVDDSLLVRVLEGIEEEIERSLVEGLSWSQ